MRETPPRERVRSKRDRRRMESRAFANTRRGNPCTATPPKLRDPLRTNQELRLLVFPASCDLSLRRVLPAIVGAPDSKPEAASSCTGHGVALRIMEMKATRRTQAERRASTQLALVRAAVDVIAHKGYADATLLEIAQKAEVSKGALHHHFASKNALVIPVLAHCGSVLGAAMENAWRSDRPVLDRARSALRAVWQARRDGWPEVSVLAHFAALAAHDVWIREHVRTAYGQMERDLAACIETALGTLGHRSRLAPAVTARWVLSVLAGYALAQGVGVASDDEDGAALDAVVTTLVVA